ncbi:hypothetical protein J5N97_029368 [Dioscorea zingiberensis]|uniref:Protein TILLER ANGLE CONTROL 1 n=1 Tax=Dioscorea zingiberensis TaxID=325984 RepID=A0A9D5H5J9_9LILI|nr:hypothetical protein J5N97_029368 [Dioscorea zingiberensis]
METDQEALLLHNVLDGILTIGTLGLQDIHHSPLPPDDHEYGNAKEEEKEEEEEEEEDHEHSQEVEEVEIKVAMVPLSVSKSLRSSFREKDNEKQSMEVVVKVVAEQDQQCHKELMVEPLLKEDKERNEKGRTTLADLFAASDASPKKGKSTTCPPKERINEEPTKEKKNNNNNYRNKKKNEENPMVDAKTTIKATKKMKRLITRMLKKKKVHPEMVVSGLIETASLMSKEMEKISLINQDIGHPWRDQDVHDQIGC